MESFGLAQRLSIEPSEAQQILDAYFVAFPAVRAFMDRTVVEARSRGYTETLFGRRRPLPDLHSPNRNLRMAAERQAMNAGIQGLAADLFKVALVRLDAALEEKQLASRARPAGPRRGPRRGPARRGGGDRGPGPHRHAQRGRRRGAGGPVGGIRRLGRHVGRRQGLGRSRRRSGRRTLARPGHSAPLLPLSTGRHRRPTPRALDAWGVPIPKASSEVHARRSCRCIRR